jgi:hypothetical protein
VGEAYTWHALASIDLDQGQHNAAKERLEKAMEVMQQIGDQACEAATFYQLGFLAKEQGRAQEGLRLVAFCCLIDASIGHGKTQNDFKALLGMASELNHTQEQIDTMLKEAAEAYEKDRG